MPARRCLQADAPSAASPTAHGVSVCSMVHVLKDVRKPCTVALSARPALRSTLVRVMSLSIRPGRSGDGKHSPEPSSSSRASINTSRAWALRGTRCSMPAFMREPGIVQVAPSMSISSQVAPLASPDRAAVSTKNFRQCFEAGDVWDASTVLETPIPRPDREAHGDAP